MSDSAPRARKHFPALDGVRGIALLLVMLDHWSVICAGPWSALPKGQKLIFALADAGWCGVDLFFVLSGFLITGILLDSRATRAASYFRNFYTRRTLRIFPPYYLFLLVWLLWRPSFVSPSEHAAFVADQGWYWAYLQNWRMSFHGWPGAGVDHLWSLAIEEQFYLVWPIVVLAAGVRGTVWAAVMLIIASPIARAVTLSFAPHAQILLYASTATQLDTLAWGALLAAAMRTPALADRLHAAAPKILAAGAGALLMLVLVDRQWTKFDWGTQVFGFAALALFFTGLLARLLTCEGRLSRLFSLPVLRQVGKVSYVGYILHLPIFVATAHFVDPTTFFAKLACLALGAMLTFAAALLSWHIFEKPLLALKDRLAPSHISSPAAR